MRRSIETLDAICNALNCKPADISCPGNILLLLPVPLWIRITFLASDRNTSMQTADVSKT
ncbi:helix-turn-helix domain-containing protein [Parapedobacter pyrenivorans]|uniref:helix-turn-helix domain-containing protein n=1 Tax=Parapedobacter pyrenivorans TaxID=1305674 RepID=UPI0035307535